MTRNSSRISLVIVFVIAASAFGAKRDYAATLDLLGVGWDKSVVTVLVTAARNVTPQAIQDFDAAVFAWNTGNGSPTLSLVNGVNSADIVIRMNLGGGAVLGHTFPK